VTWPKLDPPVLIGLIRIQCDENWNADGSCARCVTSNFLCRRPVLTDIVARRAQRKAAAAADGSNLRSVRPPTVVQSTASSSSQAGSASPPPRSTVLTTQPPTVEPASRIPLPSGSSNGLAAGVRPGIVAGSSGSQPPLASLPFPVVALSPRPAAINSIGFRPTPPVPLSPDWSNLDFLAAFPEFEALLASQGFAADSLSAPASPAPFAFDPTQVFSGGRLGATAAKPIPLSPEPVSEPVEEIERDAHFEGALVLKSVGVEKGVAHVYNSSWNIQFLLYLPAEVVQDVLRYWDEICGDVPLTKAASTMCALLYCHGQERFGRAQKDSIAEMMRRYQRKTISLISQTKVPFAHELLTFSDLYCECASLSLLEAVTSG
jgi:hypothetical protein